MDMVNSAVEAAKAAGAFLLENFGKVKHIKIKGDRNLATDVDQGAEKIIVDRIKSDFPGHGILAEEKERKDLDNKYLWIIDPLDGTHNYIKGINIFGVSIGLLYKGEFVLGIVYMPVEDELYLGERGGGAYKNGEKISVSFPQKLRDCYVSFDSSIRYSPGKMIPSLERVSKEVFNIRMLGSSARLLTYLAEGKLDAAIEYNDRPWDFAGSVAIIREAGGEFTDLKGKQPDHRTLGYVAASPDIHQKIMELL